MRVKRKEEGRKEGRKERRKEGRKEGRKKGRKESNKDIPHTRKNPQALNNFLLSKENLVRKNNFNSIC